jgi:hypothetical protein
MNVSKVHVAKNEDNVMFKIILTFLFTPLVFLATAGALIAV